MSRRDFLCSLGALALGACADPPPVLPPGALLGMSAGRGHGLRERRLAAGGPTRRVSVLIVGAGIAGLSAAWQLSRQGIDDFVVLEMEDAIGGNSRAGHSAVSAYPWGAHYLPLPGSEAGLVGELLRELGVEQGRSPGGKPLYDENYLCAMPQERIWRDGLWQPGLLPQIALAPGEQAEQARFQAHMDELKVQRGRDGRRVFALPMQYSSRDPAWRALDAQSFTQWLAAHGYQAPTVRWLADYACRDDYGMLSAETSAWAGLHYFACRNGEAANAASDTVLTAADGNGWLVRGLARRASGRIVSDAMVWQLAEDKAGMVVDVQVGSRPQRYLARQVVWAAPLFVLPHVWRDLPGRLKSAAQAGDYAPWLTANLHLSALPEASPGAPLAWDNVLYASRGLGYIVATHQQIRRQPGPTVLTWYRALHDMTPAAGRRLLLETSQAQWAAEILGELAVVHPAIGQLTERLDVFRNGHAMRRPVPGSVWGEARRLLAAFNSRHLCLAHADQSAFSLFEEAQYRGVMAARHVARRLAASRLPA